jgi:hypothetical protein
MYFKTSFAIYVSLPCIYLLAARAFFILNLANNEQNLEYIMHNDKHTYTKTKSGSLLKTVGGPETRSCNACGSNPLSLTCDDIGQQDVNRFAAKVQVEKW